MRGNWFAPSRLIVVLSLLLITTSASAEDPARTLRVVPSADVSELDPTQGLAQISRIYSQMVFDTLFALDRNLAPKPMMVDSTDVSTDQLTYRFHLRPNLHFQDGSPVTTRDVIASLRRWMRAGSIGPRVARSLDTMAAIDDSTFEMKLKQPFGLLEFALAGAGAPLPGIMRAADAERPANVALTEPIGSGPFRYVASERVVGQKVVFARNPDYPARAEPPDGLAGGRVVNVDRVEWTIIPDATTAANALATREVDFWDSAASTMLSFLRGRGVTVRRTTTLPMTGFIRPNFQTPPFNDARARQALALLLDQKEMMQAVNGDDAPWSTCYSFSVCGSPLGTEVGSEPYRAPDVARAHQLLAEAGYKGEEIVVIGTPQLAPISAMSQVIAQRLKDAGLNVKLDMGDWPVQFKRVNTPGNTNWNVFPSYALGGTWFNPLTNVALDTSCDNTNFAGFPCDKRALELRDAVFAAPDDAVRKPAFEAFQRYMWQFIPYVPSGQFDVQNAYTKQVSGVLDSYVIAYWNIVKH